MLTVLFELPGSAAAPRHGAAAEPALRAVPDDDGWPAEPADQDPSSAVRAAVAAERTRIARELHDSLSASMLGVAAAAASLASSRQRTALDQRLSDLAWHARQAVSDAWCAINDLRDDGLGGAVTNVATAWGIVTGVRVALAVSPGCESTAEIRREFVGILRDLLHNVEQHAHASRVRVSLRRVAGRLVLTVADNGAGFRPPADSREPLHASRRGLIGIAERARRVGGILIIRSRPGRGTRVVVQAPLPTAAWPHLRAVESAPPVRVVIADDDPALRAGLRQVLERTPGVEIVAEAGSSAEAVEQVRGHRPDVLLYDARLRSRAGPPPAITQISQLGQPTQLLMVTCVPDTSLVVRSVAAGVSGYVTHGAIEPGELGQILVDTARRKSPLPPGTATAVAERLQNEISQLRAGRDLTPREQQVMGLIADGLSNRQIAARLVISEKTVKNHICSIYQRFGVYERSQAVSQWLGHDGHLTRPARPAS